MNLHLHNEAFEELVGITAQTFGLPEVYVEKDYWITQVLEYLSTSNFVDQLIFKGGTSLSKAYRLINRFSEDIDIALISGGNGDSTTKKLLKEAENILSKGLVYLPDDLRESKGSKYRKTVYQYPRTIKANAFGQASSQLLLEINAFTNPEPFQNKRIQSLITDMLEKRGEISLIAEFHLEGFYINVLSVERTLIEKLLGLIKDSYDTHPVNKLSSRIRHLYDIYQILRHKQYQDFIGSERFISLCHLCIQDEKSGFGQKADYFEKSLAHAPLFENFTKWRPSLKSTYENIFSSLVYASSPLPSLEDIEQVLFTLQGALRECDYDAAPSSIGKDSVNG